MYKYRNENNKAIGTDGWNADREESSSCIYTGLWDGSVLVGLIVESMGDDDSHDEMVARFHAKAQDVVRKCNAYDKLIENQAQLVLALKKLTERAMGFNVSGVYFGEMTEDKVLLDSACDALDAVGESE